MKFGLDWRSRIGAAAAGFVIAVLSAAGARAGGAPPDEAVSIRLARDCVLAELAHIDSAYYYAQPSFRRAQIELFADLLVTENVCQDDGGASTTHPAALRFLKRQGTILKTLLRDPGAVFELLQLPISQKRRLRFEKALQLYLRTLRSD